MYYNTGILTTHIFMNHKMVYWKYMKFIIMMELFKQFYEKKK